MNPEAGEIIEKFKKKNQKPVKKSTERQRETEREREER